MKRDAELIHRILPELEVLRKVQTMFAGIVAITLHHQVGNGPPGPGIPSNHLGNNVQKHPTICWSLQYTLRYNHSTASPKQTTMKP